MKNKLILTTILSGSLLLSSNNASAAYPTYDITADSKFLVDNRAFNDYDLLKAYLNVNYTQDEVMTAFTNAIKNDNLVEKVATLYENGVISYDEMWRLAKDIKNTLGSGYLSEDVIEEFDTELAKKLSLLERNQYIDDEEDFLSEVYSYFKDTDPENFSKKFDYFYDYDENSENESYGYRLQEVMPRLTLDYINNAYKTNNQTDIGAIQKFSIFTPDIPTTSALEASNQMLADIIDHRIETEIKGVASGDAFERTGVWVKGTVSRGEQKKLKFNPAYKLAQNGFSIGVDAGDDFVIGAAYSMLHSDIKSTGFKDNVISHIGTLYGAVNLDKFFVTSQFNYGFSQVKKKREIGDKANNIARAKTNGALFGGRIDLGYNFLIEHKALISPSIGISHVKSSINKYSEKGLGANRSVGKRTSQKTDLTAGVSGKILAGTFSDISVIPEVHANMHYNLNSKNNSTKIYLINDLNPITIESAKPTKLQYKVGGGIGIARSKIAEAKLNYDFGVAKKYHSHTGSLALKINF